MKINEVFKSIQGETTYQGLPFIFIRTTGCNLRCNWCDTQYAYYDGTEYSVDDLLKIVEKFNCRYVVITGGEPLMQEETPVLVRELIQRGYKVLVETNGSLDISRLHPGAIKIVDIKCPGSGMTERILWENISYLSSHDEVKFVISDYDDYRWTKSVITSRKLSDICPVLLSPASGKLDPSLLAGWIINDHLQARLQLQIHKYIWGPDIRGV